MKIPTIDPRRALCLTLLIAVTTGITPYTPLGCQDRKFTWGQTQAPAGFNAENPAAGSAAANTPSSWIQTDASHWVLVDPTKTAEELPPVAIPSAPASGTVIPAKPPVAVSAAPRQVVDIKPVIETARVATEGVMLATPLAPYVPIADLIFRALALTLAWFIRPKPPALPQA